MINRDPSPGEASPRDVAERIARLPASDRARLSVSGNLEVSDQETGPPGTWSVSFPQNVDGPWVTVYVSISQGQSSVVEGRYTADGIRDVIERTTERRRRGRKDPLVAPIDAPTAEQRKHDAKMTRRGWWGGAIAGTVVSVGLPLLWQSLVALWETIT